MTFNEHERELLLRFLDQAVSEAERKQVAVLLRTNPAARAFLREIAEQSVMVADLERTALANQRELESDSIQPRPQRRTRFAVPFRVW